MGWLRLGAHSESLGYSQLNHENNALQQFFHFRQVAGRAFCVRPVDGKGQHGWLAELSRVPC